MNVCIISCVHFLWQRKWYDTKWYDTLREAGEQKNSNHVFLLRKLKDGEKGRKREWDEVGGVADTMMMLTSWRERRSKSPEMVWIQPKPSKNLMLSNHFKSNISSREIYSLHHNSDARQRPIPNTNTYSCIHTHFSAFWVQFFAFCTLCNLGFAEAVYFFLISSHLISSLKYSSVPMKTGKI